MAELLTDDQLVEMKRHWEMMRDDPYFPSDPKILHLIMEVMAWRALNDHRKSEQP